MKRIWNWLHKPSSWKTIGAFVILASPVLLYIWQFGRFEISRDPQDWGVFGDYIGGVYTVLVTIFAIYLTRNLDKRDAERKKAKAAVGIIYEQISRIDYKHIDMRSVKNYYVLQKKMNCTYPNIYLTN